MGAKGRNPLQKIQNDLMENIFSFPKQTQNPHNRTVFRSLIAHLISELQIREWISGSWLRQPYFELKSYIFDSKYDGNCRIEAARVRIESTVAVADTAQAFSRRSRSPEPQKR